MYGILIPSNWIPFFKGMTEFFLTDIRGVIMMPLILYSFYETAYFKFFDVTYAINFFINRDTCLCQTN